MAAIKGVFMAAQEQIEVFAMAIFEPEDIVEVRRLPSGRSTWHRAMDLADDAAEILEDNWRGENIYVGVNPRRRIGGRRGEDVAIGRALVADFDKCDIDTAVGKWERAGLPEPTLVVNSGHGIHIYLRLPDAVPAAEWTRLQKELIALVGSDLRIHDAPRIIRLPGTDNMKSAPVACEIVAEVAIG